jgi:hypothetical protein
VQAAIIQPGLIVGDSCICSSAVRKLKIPGTTLEKYFSARL